MTLGTTRYAAVYCLAATALFLWSIAVLDPIYCHAKETGRISDFCLVNVKNGKYFHSKQHRGTGLIITFGSIYCRPCIKLLPILNKLHAEHETAPIKIISVDIDATEDMQTIKKFASSNNVRFPFLLDTAGAARKNRICILPTTLFVNGNGTITKRFRGFQTYGVLAKEAVKLKQSIK